MRLLIKTKKEKENISEKQFPNVSGKLNIMETNRRRNNYVMLVLSLI